MLRSPGDSTAAGKKLSGRVRFLPRGPRRGENLLDSHRRDCLDHVIVLSEQHVRRILRKYLEYVHGSRTHLALDKDTPEIRQRESPDGGNVVAVPMVGGLHHRDTRRAAYAKVSVRHGVGWRVTFANLAS